MVVRRAYRFALDPSPAQERALRSHAGAARFAWNWGLARCNQRYAAERKWYSAAELHKLWNAQKKTDPGLGWWAENSKCACQEAFRNLDRALRDFTRSRKGQRKGKRLGFPRFKKRGRCKDSFRLTGTIRCVGPFVETKEQVAGFDVLECDDLDEAIEAAARHPMARGGIVEVRPFRRLGED